MPSKPPGRPRYRYVLVRVEPSPGPPRDELVHAIQSWIPHELGAWLTRYDGEHAIVRVDRAGADALRERLEADPSPGGMRLRPLLTSGSIAGLQRKHRGARNLDAGRR